MQLLKIFRERGLEEDFIFIKKIGEGMQAQIGLYEPRENHQMVEENKVNQPSSNSLPKRVAIKTYTLTKTRCTMNIASVK